MNRNANGFTLIELIIYIGISAIILLGIATLFGLLFSAQTSSRAVAEVDEQGQAAMTVITQSVRNAAVITFPAKGSSSSTLIIQPLATSTATTTFNLSGTSLQIKEGAPPPVSLTASDTSVTALTFTNLTATGTPGIVRIQFTLNHIKNQLATSTVYDYTGTFYDSASLRP